MEDDTERTIRRLEALSRILTIGVLVLIFAVVLNLP